MFNFNYDPQRQGYDTGLWKTLVGTPTVSSNDLLFNADSAIQYADCLRGCYNFKITLPAAPAAGDDKTFGLSSLNKGTKAVFKIVDDALNCVTTDEKGETNTAIIPWVAAWSSAAAIYQIKWSGQGVGFFVNGEQVATFTENVPNSPMSVYIANADADNMLVSYIEGLGIESYL